MILLILTFLSHLTARYTGLCETHFLGEGIFHKCAVFEQTIMSKDSSTQCSTKQACEEICIVSHSGNFPFHFVLWMPWKCRWMFLLFFFLNQIMFRLRVNHTMGFWEETRNTVKDFGITLSRRGKSHLSFFSPHTDCWEELLKGNFHNLETGQLISARPIENLPVFPDCSHSFPQE